MKVILIKDVPKLGRRFDIKDISSGHAQNFLIPRGLVIVATKDAMKRIEVERKQVENERALHEQLMVKNIQGLDGVTLTIRGKANEKGHLFAGLHKEDIVREIETQTQLQVDPLFLQLEHPIKVVGTHEIRVRVTEPTLTKAMGDKKEIKFTIVIEKA